MTSVYSDMAKKAQDKDARQAELKRFFSNRLEALENVFAAKMDVFNKYFVRMFMLSTLHGEELRGDKFDQALGRFETFLEDRDILMPFFYWLYYFNQLNLERGSLDQKKKTSLSARLEDEINHGEPLESLRRQILLCGILKGISGRLVEIAGEHKPLDQVKRVLGEIFDSGNGDSESSGLLEKLQDYYGKEIEKIREALVFKRILFMNAGHKEAGLNRKQWLEEIDLATASRLAELLKVPDSQDGRLTKDQQEQVKLYNTVLQKIEEAEKEVSDDADGNDDSASPGRLDEGILNLLILRLGNNSLLEEQIERIQRDLEQYRRQQGLDLQSNMVKSYNDNIKRLSQCLYYYIEMNALKNKAVENKAKEVFATVSQEVRALEQELNAGETGQEGAAEETQAEEGAPESAESSEEAKPEEAKEDKQKKKEPEKEKKIDPSTIKDPQRRAEVMASQLKDMPDSNKIKPLKELACIGGLDALKYILPLSQYRSEFLRNLARSTTIKIILRLLRENEDTPILGIQQKKKLIDFVVGPEQAFLLLAEP